jgi:FKBP-type peptidyl-prolyl cis-trans isomerase
MKKTVLILAAVTLAFASADAKEKKQKKSKKATETAVVKVLNNDVDSMSYALGLNVGADFAKNIQAIPGGKSNVDLLIKGFTTAMKGDSALMTAEFATEYFRNYIAEAQTKEADEKRSGGINFLEENKSKEGVSVTESGLQYQVLVPAEGPKPKAVDSVKVHYQGYLLDGTKFDSSVDRGEPIVFPLNQVIPGWTEGVQLMSVGAKYKFFVPYELGYGDKGAGGVIPPFATLIFEVELLDIMPLIEAPVVEEKPAAPAKKQAKVAATPKSTNKK